MGIQKSHRTLSAIKSCHRFKNVTIYLKVFYATNGSCIIRMRVTKKHKSVIIRDVDSGSIAGGRSGSREKKQPFTLSAETHGKITDSSWQGCETILIRSTDFKGWANLVIEWCFSICRVIQQVCRLL